MSVYCSESSIADKAYTNHLSFCLPCVMFCTLHVCVCLCHVASDSRGASGYDSRQGSRSSAHHGKVLDVSGCRVLDIAALPCVFVHLAFCWSWHPQTVCKEPECEICATQAGENLCLATAACMHAAKGNPVGCSWVFYGK